jgi:uncharacterized protein (DUF58 family)
MLLTDPIFIRRLESLYLLARKVLGGTLQADRKSARKGAGVTFADYSEYSWGDDYRAIDWRVYARLDTLMIKLFELEEDVTIYFLLDSSKSMEAKFLYARQLAAALAYIALHSMDKVVIYGMAEGLRSVTRPTLGRGKTLAVLQELERAELFGSGTDFTAATRQLCQWHKRRGLVLVVSDFLFPGGFKEGLKFLRWHHHDVFCIQVQDEVDRACRLKGDVELQCIESGQRRKLTVTRSVARAYEQAVCDWNARLRECCALCGIGLVSITQDVPFDTVVQSILRRGGLIS